MRAGSYLFIGLAAVSCLGLAAGTTAPAGASDGPDTVVELGRRLFFDASVSRTGTVACSSCHDPEHGFSDARVISADEHGPAPRHSQTVVNLTGKSFHWDGEFKTLGELVAARIAPPAEAALATQVRVGLRHKIAGDDADPDLLRRRNIATTSGGYPGLAPQPVVANPPAPLANAGARHEAVTARLAGDQRYESAFRDAFGSTDVTTDRIGKAIAAYLSSLRSTDSPYDAFVAGDAEALSPAAARGHELFGGKAGCASCHAIEREGKAASTPRFRNTGVAAAQVGRMKQTTAHAVQKAAEQAAGQAGVELAQNGIFVAEPQDDAGRAGATLLAGDRHKFKVPNLRDVALRAPYMHDGSLPSLQAVVTYYNQGGTKDDGLHSDVKPLGLDDGQVGDLVAFLDSLTGHERAGLGPVPADRPARHEVRVLDLSGQPLARLPVTVRPAGDRLAGTTRMPGTFSTVTRDDGTLSFPFPAATHVTFEAEGHEIGVGRALPDFANGLELRATPNDTVSIRIRRRAGDSEFPDEIGLVESVGIRVVMEPTEDGEQNLRLVSGSGSALTLERIATIGTDEAIYAAPVPKDAKRALMNVDFNGESLGPFDVDPTGGASEAIDLGAPPAGQTAALQIPGGGSSFHLVAGDIEITTITRVTEVGDKIKVRLETGKPVEIEVEDEE